MRLPGTEIGFSPEQKQESGYDILENKETRERLKERMLRFVKAVHDRQVDSLVFLDRSARPLSWMFQDLWSGLYQKEMRPDIKYVNIGTSSHVHRGVAHLLKSNYWGSYERGTQGTTSDTLNVPIIRAEKTDKWLSTSQIPREWQNSILENVSLVEELQSVFKKEFEGKSVLIVDEMGATGKSQMAALGFFSLAFPGARMIESVPLFYSRQFHDPDFVSEWNKERDKEIIPWLQELGMAGVLELPDEALMSGVITKENIQRILPILQTSIENLQKDVEIHDDDDDREKLERNLERKELYEHPEKLLQRARQLRKELKQLAADALADQSKKTKPLV